MSTGGATARTLAPQPVVPLPPDIESAYLCTTYGLHGYVGTSVNVRLDGYGGHYDSYDPSGLNPFGSLSDVSYGFDSDTVEGHWTANGQSGWFRWAFYDEHDFYGSWGYGPQVAENEAGYWNGGYCPQ
jgi:hypothetical protein